MRRLHLLFLAVALTVCSCADPYEPKPSPYTPGGSDNTPTAVIKGFTLDNSLFYRYSPECQVAVHVSIEDGMSYDVVIPETAGWISTSTLHNDKSGYVNFDISANATGKDRSALVEFKYGPDSSKKITISQSAAAKQDFFAEWGLEGSVVQTVSNDRPYNWYIDQGDTGTYSSVNCGPSSATMCAKWFNPEYLAGAEAAREEYSPTGGWWYAKDIDAFLTAHKISYRKVQFATAETLKNEIANGNIAILNPDMYYFTYNSNNTQRVNKYYQSSGTGSGHYLVVKGFVQTDSKLYFEVYDPWSLGKTYLDMTRKGMDRYYTGEETLKACQVWYSTLVVIQKPS